MATRIGGSPAAASSENTRTKAQSVARRKHDGWNALFIRSHPAQPYTPAQSGAIRSGESTRKANPRHVFLPVGNLDTLLQIFLLLAGNGSLPGSRMGGDVLAY